MKPFIICCLLLLFTSCNQREEGYKYYSTFNYSKMIGENEITSTLLERPYVAVKRENNKLELKIFGYCNKTTLENFEKKDGYWYGHSKIEDKLPKGSNLKKLSLNFENHYYIFNDTILKYTITKNLNDDNEEYPISVSLERKNKLYEFASLERDYSRGYNIDELKKSSLSINGTYRVTETNVKNDTLVNRSETIYKDGSNKVYISKYKLNGSSTFFINDYCNDSVNQLSFDYERN